MSCRVCVQFCGEEPGADGAAERGPAVLGQSDTIQGAGSGAGEGRGARDWGTKIFTPSYIVIF